MRLLCVAACFSIASSFLMTAQPPLAHAQKLDNYGDPLLPGAVLRLGTSRLQARGGFGWLPDGKSLVTMRHGTIFFWDLEGGHCRETMLAPFSGYRCELALAKDGKRLVCTGGDDGRVAVWDLENVKLTAAPDLPPGSHEINSRPAFAPDGQSIVTLDESIGRLRLWDAATALCAEP